jgi:catechol 2,3-dioxygenase-like lactoylglutathione lyase family enzyme
MQILRIDHVQLAMPRGGEDEARAFYAGVLGLSEVAKPAGLAARGGVWFESGDAKIHLGIEEDFAPRGRRTRHFWCGTCAASRSA